MINFLSAFETRAGVLRVRERVSDGFHDADDG